MIGLASVLDQPCVHIRLWREDGVWIAKCLDIPGCISEGSTREEALANIHDAIVMCLEVIVEDTTQERGGSEPTVEVIERPIEEFLRAS
jgi:predicted RNase H-like HicB family nuclease